MTNKDLYNKILNGDIPSQESDNVESLGYPIVDSVETNAYLGSNAILKTAWCEDTVDVPNSSHFSASVLIIGGGGGGGYQNAAGGGAGGYREFTKKYFTGINYTVTVGAGGAGSTSLEGSNGNDSSIERIATGGGGGGGGFGSFLTGADGGSGGGGISGGTAGSSTDPRCNGSSQGNSGNSSGGGGGAGAAATDANGGDGSSSSITGSSVTRGGGGGGAFGGVGGSGGGGDNPSGDGTVNTGGGGGGGGGIGTQNGGNGGSGFVVIKFPDTYSITIGGGLTYTSSTSGGYTTVQFTAGTDTISFAAPSNSQEYTDSLLLYPFDSDANDASSTGNNLTLTNASIDTSVKKYGAGSLKFTGSLSNGKAQGVMPSLGTNDFTIEFWLYMASMSNGQYILDRGQGSNAFYDNPGFAFLTTTSSRFVWTIKDSYDSGEGGYGASVELLSSSLSSAVGSWVHVALVRQGTTYRMYIDGTQETSGTGSATDFAQHNFAVGDAMVNGGGVAQNSYIDDFRLSNTAVYPDGTTFTVPSAAHPTS